MKDQILRHPPFVLLDDSQPAQTAGMSSLFHSPDRLIIAQSVADIDAALKEIDSALATGFHVAGYIAYEAAAAFEEKLSHIADQSTAPLIWMMVTKHRELLPQKEIEDLLKESDLESKKTYSLQIAENSNEDQTYLSALKKVSDYIHAGDVYQINYTFPLEITLKGDRLALYRALRQSQPVPYGAYIDTGELSVLSFSPELFVARRDNQLSSRPMKGTIRRGKTLEEDQHLQNSLISDEKSQAENLMIVDLIRNDFSRIAKPHSVSVPKLFETEVYKTVIQMTSEVQADVDKSLTPSSMIKALFPCGSVTGAPKVRAMEIIHELENGPRNVYCGAIGHFSPASGKSPLDWTLNVPIRTLTLDKTGKGSFHIGSGVVADSAAEQEYEECLLKGKFLTELHASRQHAPALFETMGFDSHSLSQADQDENMPRSSFIMNFDLHMRRLHKSATYFGYPYDKATIDAQLDMHLKAIPLSSGIHRIKLIMDFSGKISIQSSVLDKETNPNLEPNSSRGKIAFASHNLYSGDYYLYHKTTRRDQYDRDFEQAQKLGLEDIIYLNERGEVCEGAISSLFIKASKSDTILLTPALTSGLLPGILRASLIANGLAEEATLTKKQIEDADQIFIGNSLRGLRRVKICTASNGMV
ncbi:aminodeoxychorismate synthase component I [Temperatibacter marinus]|uniref:Probable branched-chain-amino-acid aminotransferase n=1 Tax=Temperatibacter marinus TaxID=1456591 RepID=A0AA52EIE6_9PROT|nr:aminodeoxychorismate synthase component I [Temperatibacter marinus]WND02879.1 aminodeoxychorismate synthase component I [Temperatibacter marinus]